MCPEAAGQGRAAFGIGRTETPAGVVMRPELRLRKRERYLRAARVILLRDGFDALTMQAIASEVGAAVGTIYGYFPSKQALVAELQVEAITTMLDAWSEARGLWLGDLSRAGVAAEDF